MDGESKYSVVDRVVSEELRAARNQQQQRRPMSDDEEKKFESMAAFVRAQPLTMSGAAVAELGQLQGFTKLTA